MALERLQSRGLDVVSLVDFLNEVVECEAIEDAHDAAAAAVALADLEESGEPLISFEELKKRLAAT